MQVADDPFDLDMTYTGSSNTNPYVIKNGYSSVLRLKTGSDLGYSDIVVEPNLAERWEVSQDGKTYTFHLRKGVKFANLPPVNGRELTAADVKWSFEYTSRTGAVKDAKLPPARYDYFFEGLESLQTPDPYTVVVKFKDVFAPFLTYVASSDNVIMPHEIYGQDGHFKDRLVGAGPFQPDFAASQKGTRFVLKKNPTYFEEGKPYLDEVNILIIREEATRLAAFQTKQVDYFVGGRDASVWDEVKRLVPDAVSYEFTNTPAILALNLTRPPFDNLKVRKAVSLGLDRDELVKVGAGGRGEWALAFSNMRNDLFTQQEIKSFIKSDQEQARRLLQEAGFSQGFQTDMIFSEADDETAKVAQLIQAQLKKVGIDILLKPLDPTENTKRRRAFDLNMMLLSEASRADLDGGLFLAVYTGGPSNYNKIADPKTDALIQAQRKEGDPAKRRELLREVLRHINESALAIPMYRTNQAIFTHPYVKDWYHSADLRTQGVARNVWLAK